MRRGPIFRREASLAERIAFRVVGRDLPQRRLQLQRGKAVVIVLLYLEELGTKLRRAQFHFAHQSVFVQAGNNEVALLLGLDPVVHFGRRQPDGSEALRNFLEFRQHIREPPAV